MGYEIQPRVERKSTAGMVLTAEEVETAVAKDLQQSSSDGEAYEVEVPRTLRNLALAAEFIGQNACGRSGVCDLKCTGVSLLDTVSVYDGQLMASCEVPDCDDSGIRASFQEFLHSAEQQG